jgi:hypothetical protein
MTISIAQSATSAPQSPEPLCVRKEERLPGGIVIPAKWVVPGQGNRKQLPTPAVKARKPAARNEAFDLVAPTAYAKGYSPVPLVGKIPRITGWTDKFCASRPTAVEITGEWGRKARGKVRFDGVGIACHNGVVFIDIDIEDWQPVYARLLIILPELDGCPAIFGRRGLKLMLRAADGVNHRAWNVPLRVTNGILEVLAHGRQGVIPPTIHPVSGKDYVWRDDAVTPLIVRAEDLPKLTVEHVAAIRAEFPPAPKKAEAKTALKDKAVAAKKEARKAEREATKWDGHADAMRRCTTALGYLDADSYEHWNIAADAFASWAGDAGRDPWDAWSKKSPKYDAVAQDAQWAKSGARAADGGGSGMGAIIAMAAKLGFDKSLKAWPTLYTSHHGNRVQQGDSPFEVAVAAMPKGPKFREALSAQRRAAMRLDALSPRDWRLLDWLHAFASEAVGFAWPSERRLIELVGTNERGITDAMRNLVRAGLIVVGPFKSNPQQLPTMSYAFLPPKGKSWDDVLLWQAKLTAHAVGEC